VLGWPGQGYQSFSGKPNENATINCLAKHMAYVFYKFHFCFFLSVIKKQIHHDETHLQTAVKISHIRAKHSQVERTRMVATARFTIRVFVTFSDC